MPTAAEYVKEKGWQAYASATQLVVRECPLCHDTRSKFSINNTDTEKNGLWDCKVCHADGNLHQLMVRLGDRVEGIHSLQDWVHKPQILPSMDDVEKWARDLVDDPGDVHDYCVDRQLSDEVIRRQRLGVMVAEGQPWLVIPFFERGHLVGLKRRSVPPAPKAYRNASGSETPLYNSECITDGMSELWVVEGELDALALMSAGVPSVVGVPGANVRKASWIKRIEDAHPGKIFLMYDTDQVGQHAAREMAERIGIARCHNVVLPPFSKPDGTPGKDCTDWFCSGHSVEQLREIADAAQPFPVEGVEQMDAALDELEAELRKDKSGIGNHAATGWPSLNARLGPLAPGDVVDVIAEEKQGKSIFALDWAAYAASTLDSTALVICLEMGTVRQVRRLVCHLTGTPDLVATSPEEVRQYADTLLHAIAETREKVRTWKADLLFGNTRANTPDDIYTLIRQSVSRYGVKFVVLDNMQLLADATLSAHAHRTVHMSQISKKLKLLATEFGLTLVRIVQPHRVAAGEIVDAQDADGSSQLAKDSDATITLYRAPMQKITAKEFNDGSYTHTDEGFRPDMLVQVARSRTAPGGTTTLWFDGATSTVREFADANTDSRARTAVPATEV